MVVRVLVAAILVVTAAGVAALLARRRPMSAPVPARATWGVPASVDRADFDRPDAPWLVAVFSSATCDACSRTVAAADVLASPVVAVQDVEFGARRDLHRRYGIEAVPIVVVADADGTVVASFVGPPTATDLWAAVAEAREPGSVHPDGGECQRDKATGAQPATPTA